MNLRNFNPRKIQFLVSFSWKTIFAQSSPTTGQRQFDVKFYGESYGAQDMTGLYWVQKLYIKNLDKVEKILNIQEYPKKFKHFSGLLDVCFHINRSKIKYLSTEKTWKNPRNFTDLKKIYQKICCFFLNFFTILDLGM